MNLDGCFLKSYRKFLGVENVDSYHHIVLANKMDAPNTQEVDIAGNVCESGNLFARDRPIRDLLAILNAGAYGFTMSSNYNSRPKASEVLVKDGECFLTRERRNF